MFLVWYRNYMTDTLFDRLLLASHLLHRDMERAFAGTPLTEARAGLLWVVQTLGPTTQQGIADALGVSARQVSALTDALEGAGYVRRSPHPTDRRAVLVDLTESAQQLMTTMQQAHAAVAATLVESVAPADREAFRRGLDAVVDRLAALVAEAEAGGAGPMVDGVAP